jgi:hypothetical protein
VGLKLQKIRKIKVLIISLSLLLILCSFSTQRAYGAIEKEYEYSEVIPIGGELLYRFRLKVVIETERDGTWKPGTEYHVNFIVILDYINSDRIKSLTFYNPRLSLLYVEQKLLSPQNPPFIVLSYPYQMGDFELLVKLYYNWEGSYTGRAAVSPNSYINITWINHTPEVDMIRWSGNEPIYIYEYKAPVTPLEPLSMVTGLAVGVVISAASIMLGIKIGEKRAEKKKANP